MYAIATWCLSWKYNVGPVSTKLVQVDLRTSSKTMLWWMKNAVGSKVAAYFVCYYMFNY